MAYLIERKSQTIFVTATSIIAKGKPREMIVESRPEYAVVQLSGIQKNSLCRGRKCTQRRRGGMKRISESKAPRVRSGNVPPDQKISHLRSAANSPHKLRGIQRRQDLLLSRVADGKSADE